MKRGILFVIFIRKQYDKNFLPKNFNWFIGILFIAAVAAILVGKFVMGYNIF